MHRASSLAALWLWAPFLEAPLWLTAGWETCLPVKTPGQCWLSSSGQAAPWGGTLPPGEGRGPRRDVTGGDSGQVDGPRVREPGRQQRLHPRPPNTRPRPPPRPLGHRPPTRGRGRLLVPWGMDARVWQRTHCAELPGPGCPKPRDPGSDLLLTWVTAAAAAQSPQGLGKGRAELGSHKAP